MKQDNNKLETALNLLGNEFKSELPPVYLREAIKKGKVSDKQIYEALEKTNFEWIHGKWKKYTPEWITDLILQFENDLSKAIDATDIWSYQPYTRIHIFHDYLGSMEGFIQTEIDNRDRELQKLMDESKSHRDYEEDLSEKWQELIPWVKSAEDFASVLRNSFFVNLIAYSELFLTDRYRLNSKGESRDVPRTEVIERITDKLVGALKDKIPGWDEHILNYIKIRNCLVHNDGFLDDKKHQGIKNYINKTPNLKIQ